MRENSTRKIFGSLKTLTPMATLRLACLNVVRSAIDRAGLGIDSSLSRPPNPIRAADLIRVEMLLN